MKTLRSNVQVSKAEYARLKKVDKQFGAFLSYASHLTDIQKAREEAHSGRLISQAALFRKLKV